MDYNRPDHFQPPAPMVNLKSSDGEIFQVEVKVAQSSLLIKEMLDELGVEEGNEVISMPGNAPEISGMILGKILQWANHHKDDPARDEDHESEWKPRDGMSSWDAEFLQVDQTTLFEIIRAANFLNVKGLLNLTCKTVAEMIKVMNPEEIRRKFDILRDFSPKEAAQIRRENHWCADCLSRRSYTGSIVLREIQEDSVQEEVHNEGAQVTRECHENSVEVHNEGAQVAKECLENSVIVSEIFKHLTNSELFNLSTMNKMWCHEGRVLMRTQENVIASLFCRNIHSCHEAFEAFGADLDQMKVVPFSGIEVIICRISPECETVGTESLDKIHEILLARLELKHFSLTLPVNWWDYKDCPVFQLLKKMVKDFSGNLKILTLDIQEKHEEFVEQFFGDIFFSGLKVLNLNEYERCDREGWYRVDYFLDTEESYSNYMRALVLRAPKLRELHTLWPISLRENVMEGNGAILMPQHLIRVSFDEISESLIDALRLEKVELVYTGPEFNLDKFNRTAPVLLQVSCSTTLREMSVDGTLVVPLMCYGISLKHVIDLKINLNITSGFQLNFFRVLTKFDFTRIFPNLGKVVICHSCEYVQPSLGHMIAISEDTNAVLREPMADRASNIKELDLHQEVIFESSVNLFSEMFPNIQKLNIQIKEAGEGEIPLGSIWKYWPNLEELTVQGGFSQVPANLDSIFCGIFPDEVVQLREKDEDYLKSVNIVPVMPAINSLKYLKNLTLKLKHYKETQEPFVDDGTFIFSKLTGLLAFTRLPSLAVNLELETDGVPPVSHLEPFASVEWTDRSVVFEITSLVQQFLSSR